MSINPKQRVFSFLASDPHYQQERLKAENTDQVTQVVEQKVTDRVVQALVELNHAQLEAFIQDAIEDAMEPLQGLMVSISYQLEAMRESYDAFDDADWWKRPRRDSDDGDS